MAGNVLSTWSLGHRRDLRLTDLDRYRGNWCKTSQREIVLDLLSLGRVCGEAETGSLLKRARSLRPATHCVQCLQPTAATNTLTRPPRNSSTGCLLRAGGMLFLRWLARLRSHLDAQTRHQLTYSIICPRHHIKFVNEYNFLCKFRSFCELAE
jgi:hypothetical protein